MSAVNKSRCQNFHRVPCVDCYGVPRSLQQILSNQSYPLSQGPVVLPLDCATEPGLRSFTGTSKSTSEVLRERTMFSHSDSQKCYEWVPIEVGMAAFSAKISDMKIVGPASLMTMGQVYCSWVFGTLPMSCRDQSKLCCLQCKTEVCTDCSIQCTQHYVKLPRLFNVDTDHFTIITKAAVF